MLFAWIEESPSRWDDAKARIIGAAPPGVFDFSAFRPGDLLPGQWWRVEVDSKTAGFGWMDCNWGDGEVLLAVDPAAERQGVGTFIVEHLLAEGAARGINYLYNVVPESHPDAEGVEAWLERRGFRRHGDGRLLRAPTAHKAP